MAEDHMTLAYQEAWEWIKSWFGTRYRIRYINGFGYSAEFCEFSSMFWTTIDKNGRPKYMAENATLGEAYATKDEAGEAINKHASGDGEKVVWEA
jgi:hypothetical protein